MSNMHNTDIEKNYFPNSGLGLEVHGAKGSGMMMAHEWTGLIADVVRAVYGVGHTSGSFDMYSGVSHAPVTSGQLLAESAKTPKQVAFEKRRDRLIAALKSMEQSSPNWYGGVANVRPESAATASKFLNCLPFGTVLPKVADDGEGDVMFVWDDPQNSCVVTVEPRTLHLVSKPGRPDVQQVDAQQFLGVRLPPTILRYIPSE